MTEEAKKSLKKQILSMVTIELKGGELNVDIDLDGAVGVLFDEVVEPAAVKAVAKTSNTLDDSVVLMVMPIVRKEAVEFAAGIEEKLEAKIGSVTDKI